MPWLGPCSPKGNAPQHYVLTLIATRSNRRAARGPDKAGVLEALKGGKALRAASLVLRTFNYDLGETQGSGRFRISSVGNKR